MVLKETIIKKAKKNHRCNACDVIMTNFSSSEYLFRDFNFTEQEKESILKAELNGWKIKKGDPCLYRVGVWGDFYAFYVISEIDDICQKYEFYED